VILYCRPWHTSSVSHFPINITQMPSYKPVPCLDFPYLVQRLNWCSAKGLFIADGPLLLAFVGALCYVIVLKRSWIRGKSS
jgi:hypothetical protein